VYATNSDSGNGIKVAVSSYENRKSILKTVLYRGSAEVHGWIALERGCSRDLQWVGFDYNDNIFCIYIDGFRIER